MSDTPETDAAQFGTGRVSVDFARRLERERDEARAQIAKLCDIAERAINFEWYRAPYLGYPGPAWGTLHAEGLRLRAELDQIKEGAK